MGRALRAAPCDACRNILLEPHTLLGVTEVQHLCARCPVNIEEHIVVDQLHKTLSICGDQVNGATALPQPRSSLVLPFVLAVKGYHVPFHTQGNDAIACLIHCRRPYNLFQKLIARHFLGELPDE